MGYRWRIQRQRILPVGQDGILSLVLRFSDAGQDAILSHGEFASGTPSYRTPQAPPAKGKAEFNQAQNRFVAKPIDLGPDGELVFLILFGTGFRNRSSLSAVSASVGGAPVESLFAGAQGGFVGLDQANVGPLPRSLAGRGKVDLVFRVDGKAANTVRIAIK